MLRKPALPDGWSDRVAARWTVHLVISRGNGWWASQQHP